MAHELWELQQMQNAPLTVKISMTIDRIREWYTHWKSKGESVYYSWSGGKDSTVLRHLIKTYFPQYDIPGVFVDTGLEYPELREFVKKDPDIIILRPEKPFWKIVRDYGYPIISKETSECIDNARKYFKTGKYQQRYRKLMGVGEYMPQRVQKIMGTLKTKDGKDKSAFNQEKWKPLLNVPFKISSKCCSIMKKNPLHKFNRENNTHPMTAEMAEESRLRKQEWLKNGCNGFDMKEPKSMPMSFWTEQDVLRYIKEYNVEIPCVYGNVIEDVGICDGYEQLSICETGCRLKTTGCSRTGCMFCLYGSHLEKGKSRLQRMKETHPKLYQYCIGGGSLIPRGFGNPTKKDLALDL